MEFDAAEEPLPLGVGPQVVGGLEVVPLLGLDEGAVGALSGGTVVPFSSMYVSI